MGNTCYADPSRHNMPNHHHGHGHGHGGVAYPNSHVSFKNSPISIL